MADDIRFVLMDRLVRLHAKLRADGKIWGEQNPPFIEVTQDEADQLGATVGTTAGAFCQVPLKISGQ